MSDGRTKKTPSSGFHLLAGLASGFTSSILLQPADLLKTRVQQSKENSLLSSIRDIARSPNPVRQLWRGTLPSVIRTSIGSALYFTTLNALRSSAAASSLAAGGVRVQSSSSKSSSSLPQLSPLANLTCGAIARASVGFIMMPITVIKVRYESSFYAYKSLADATRGIVRTDGLRGFFSGFGATAIRDAPYAGLYILFYEWGKRVIGAAVGGTPPQDEKRTESTGKKENFKASTSAAINFTSSTLAASLSTAITNPPDAVKTRLQLHPKKYRNSAQALKLMLKEEGIRSLFNGLALRMARKAMSSALAWTVYEELTRRAAERFELKR